VSRGDNNAALLSEDNGFIFEALGNEWEIVGEPSVDPAFERTNPGDSFGSQLQRHPGAGRFVGSRAVENDVAIPGNLSVALFDLFQGKKVACPTLVQDSFLKNLRLE
jgi:hypothetical protein